MNTPYPLQNSDWGARRLALAALTLCLSMAAGTVGVSAQVDPATPTSSKGTGGGSGGGGDDGGGGDGGGGGGGGGGSHKVALGIAIEEGGDMAYLDAHTAAAGGNRPAMWVLRTAWGGNHPDFPMANANQLKSRGITPLIWWTPVDPANQNSPTYARHKNITRGDHDAYIRDYARDVKAFGDEVLIRFAHEVNSNFFPWSASKHDNSAGTFKNMWRHVHGIFEDEGVTNAKWIWSLAKEICSGGCNPFTVYYPGNAYVDVMGFTGYNWGAARNWASMWKTYKRPMINLMEISNKPIIAAETGSNRLGGDKPAWIRDGFREVYDAWPQLRGIVWTDVDLRASGHPDWRIASPAAGMTEYRKVASLSRFKGRTLFSANLSARAGGDRDKAGDKQRKSSNKPKDKKVRKATPRVDKGSNTTTVSSGKSKAGSATNKVTKRDRKKDKEPPAVVDTFSR